MCDAIAARPGAIVTVACSGGAAHLVGEEIVRALRAARIDTFVATVGRTGRVGALDQPVEGAVLVVGEAQWAPDDALADIAEPGTDGGAVVLVHRVGAATRSLAVAQLAARRNNAAFSIAPSSVKEVRDGTGVTAAEAERRVALSGGRCDLLAAIELDGSLVPDISARLSVIDPAFRHVAELLAFGLPVERLGVLLGHDADPAIDALVGEGVLDPPDGTDGPSLPTMLAGVADAVRNVTTGNRRLAVIELLGRDDTGVLVTDLAARLDESGDRSPAAGDVYRRAAEALAAADPSRALGWIDRARASGVSAGDLALAEATAAVGAGDPHRALATVRDDDRPELALVRAAAWVALGDLGAAAASLDSSPLRPLSLWARVGAGGTLDAGTDAAIDDGVDAASTLASAVRSWLAGDRDGVADAVRRCLVRHHADPEGARWPATPDLVGALLHAQLGDVDRAERLLLDAIGESRGGSLHRRAHLLASAWLAATRGRLDDAVGALDAVPAAGLPPHEALWRAGVACAIAVRDQEVDTLEPAVVAALALADVCGTHLYDLGIVTDIAAAAARAGLGRTDELLATATRAVERLGEPPTLVSDLAWARMRVALCCDDTAAIAAAARAVLDVDRAATAPLRRTVAAAVVDVDDGRVDAGTIEELSKQLADAGAPHEAARLCGIAAVRSTSESDARRLLKQSRLFRAQRAQLKRADRIDRSVVRLSEQEARVAQLVLEGRTHREIGASLFISAKTVEHHVAHIRTKLSAGSRAELLASIRAYLDAAG